MRLWRGMRARLLFLVDVVIEGLSGVISLAGLVYTLIGGSMVATFVPISTALGVAVAALIGALLVTFEGAFRVWKDTDDKRVSAEAALGAEHSREWLNRRLASERKALVRIKSDVPEDAPIDDLLRTEARGLTLRVLSDLRLAAPEYLEYWKSNPPDYDPHDWSRAAFVRMVDACIDQLDEIVVKLSQSSSSAISTSDHL